MDNMSNVALTMTKNETGQEKNKKRIESIVERGRKIDEGGRQERNIKQHSTLYSFLKRKVRRSSRKENKERKEESKKRRWSKTRKEEGKKGR